MELDGIIDKLRCGKDLLTEEAESAMQKIMHGNASNQQIADFLRVLEKKGGNADEIAAFARIMRKNSLAITAKQEHLVDTAGTGGDGSNTFNISTCAAFVAAGAGAAVAKHGNRAASSKSGSVDVLEELGVDINADEKTAEMQLENIGIAFLFARIFHPAMKTVAQVRKELGFKTVFNILGPLTNPAGAKKQVIGVYSVDLLDRMAAAIKILGTEKTILVSSDIDEVSISHSTSVREITKSEIKKYAIAPEDFGFKRRNIETIRAEGKIQSAEIILNVLKGDESAARDVILLNAGAAIYASGISGSIANGITAAEKSIDSGKAMEKLDLLRNYHG